MNDETPLSELLEELDPVIRPHLEIVLRSAHDTADLERAKKTKNVALKAAVSAAGFPPRRGGGPLLPREALTKDQLIVARFLAAYPEHRPHGFVLPPAYWVSRWLGQGPDGVLERLVSVDSLEGEVPMWQALSQLAKKPRARLVSDLPTAERLEVWVDMAMGAYDLRASGVSWGHPRMIKDDLGEWAVRVADRVVVHKVHSNTDVRRPVFLALARAKVHIEKRWDQLLPFGTCTRRESLECSLAIPEKRRATALANAVRRVPSARDRVEIGIGLLPRLPLKELADVILMNADRADSGPNRVPKKQLLAKLDAIGQKHQVVANAVAAYRASATVVPKLKVEWVRDVVSVDDLSAVTLAQVKQAGKNYDGFDLSAEERLRPPQTAVEEETSFHGMIHQISIVDDEGNPAYDAYDYMGDSGSIFSAGTTDTIAHIIQGGLQLEQDAPGLHEALRTVLREARKQRRRK